MNIYVHELKALIKSVLVWTAAMIATAAVFMCFYPIIREDMDNFLSLMNNFPPAVKAAFGMVSENFSSALGYYTFGFTYIMLFAAIQAMNAGVSIVSKETREKTADFLMTKPVPRTKILTCKLISALTAFIVTNAVYLVFSCALVAGLSDGGFDFGKFFLIDFPLFILQLIFFSLGLAVSIPAKKIKSVLPISLGTVFFFFAVSAFAVTASSDKLRYLTPFQYFKTEYVLDNAAYEPVFLWISLCIVAVCTAASYLIYVRKDIHAV